MTVRELILRLGGALGFGRRDRDLQEELAFHREMLEARHRRGGLSEAAARRAARIELGNEAHLADAWHDQRSLPFVDVLRQDIRYGLRVLRRAPGFTTAAVLTLAIGTGANAAIFSGFSAVLLRPLPYRDADRLVIVADRNPDGSLSDTGVATVLDWRQRTRSFEHLSMIRLLLPTLNTSGEAERVPALRVSADYFDMLGATAALGRTFAADEDHGRGARVIVLSDQLWRRRFHADVSVVGRTVSLNDREFEIVGVMPPSFASLDAERFFDARAELWTPIAGDQTECRNHCRIYVIGRLKAGVAPDAAAAEMRTVREQLRREFPADYETAETVVLPMREVLAGRARTALYVLLAAVGFVLLMACANVANLTLSRVIARDHELALRAALGAGRRRLVQQQLTESLLLAAAGTLAGLLMASVGTRMLVLLAPATVLGLSHAAIDVRVTAFTLLVGLLAGVICGVVPAWQVARNQPSAPASSRATGHGSRALRGSVVVNLALALVLLAAAGLMLRTVAALTRRSPGFDPSNVMTLQFTVTSAKFDSDRAIVAFQDRALAALRAVPGVERAALAGQIPFARAAGGSGDCWGFHAEARAKGNPANDPCVERFGVTPDYFAVMRIPLIGGRSFTSADRAAAQPVMLVSRSTARLVWGDADPIGSRVRIGRSAHGRWWTVVGVVDDVHLDDLTVPPAPAMYVPEPQLPSAYLTAIVKSTAHDAAALGGPLRLAIRELDPTVPVHSVATLASLVARPAAERRFVMQMLSAFAAGALLLAAIGLYGVVSYRVNQRRREIGVRIALGARPADVLRLVMLNGLFLVVIGVASGLAAAFVVTRYLGSLVFGVSPIDPVTFAGAAGLLTLVALFAHWAPSRRALRIDPARALRAE